MDMPDCTDRGRASGAVEERQRAAGIMRETVASWEARDMSRAAAARDAMKAYIAETQAQREEK